MFFCRCDIPEIHFLDVGKTLASMISEGSGDRFEQLSELMKNNMRQSDSFGPYVGIENIAILFEPDLHIDVRFILDVFSQNQVLFVKTSAEITNNVLWFLKESDGISVNLEDIPFKVINSQLV